QGGGPPSPGVPVDSQGSGGTVDVRAHRHRPAALHEEAIVPVISAPEAFNEDDLYIDLRSIFGHSLFLKSEGFNFAGSIKLKAATEMVDAAERDGILRPDSVMVESSSGNLG